MTRKTFITMSTGALVAPFVYAMTPPQGISHTIMMETPRDLIKDMRTMWLGAIDQTRDDKHPDKLVIHTHTWDEPMDLDQIPKHHVGLRYATEGDFSKFLKKGRFIVKYDLIEALAIAWMDAAGNYDRRMTNEETKEFNMQFGSFATHPIAIRDTISHHKRLSSNVVHFDGADKFYKGKFKTPMQEQIVMAIMFNGIVAHVNQLYKDAY